MDHGSGLFIVLEGGEGAGKTTQARVLAETLRAARLGHEVVATAEPGGTALGVKLRELLLQHADDAPMDPRVETLLYLADRVDHLARVIVPALDRGATVICDRFSDSTLVYQGHARNLGTERLEDLTKWVTAGLAPDIVIVLDLDPQIGLARVADRGDANRFDDESLTFHHSVRAGFLRRVDQMQRLRASAHFWNTRTPRYVIVDAAGDAVDVAERIWEHVLDLIHESAVAAR